MDKTQDVLATVGHLYDAATDMTKWPVFLESLATLFNASDSHLLHFDHDESRFTFSIGYGTGMQALQGHEHRLEEAFADDPRVLAAARFPGKPISCRTLTTQDQWHQSRTYQFLAEFGFPVEYTLAVNLPEEDGTMTGLALMRYADGVQFSTEECELLGQIIPHIKRTLHLQKRLAYADFKHRVALDALDHTPAGIITTDGEGRIEYANQAARDIAARGDGLTLSHNDITLLSAHETADLRLAIREAVVSAQSGDILPGVAMPLTRTDGAEPYPMMVSTLWGNHLRLGLGVLDAPMAILFITDLDRPQEAPAELLQRLYGLTPAEARVLQHVCEGGGSRWRCKKLRKLGQHRASTYESNFLENRHPPANRPRAQSS